jgi:Fe-S-cluster containining protein
MENRFGPCLDKKCSTCCSPVKVHHSFPDEKIPVDEKGEKIWTDRDELIIPEDHPDTVRLRTFDCKKFDSDSGQCQDYENRPAICRKSSCYDESNPSSIDEQHSRCIKEKFIIVKK